MLFKSSFNSFARNEDWLFGEMPLNDLSVNFKTPVDFSDYRSYGKDATFRVAIECNIMVTHLKEGPFVEFVYILGDGCNKAT